MAIYVHGSHNSLFSSEISSENFIKAFEMGANKIQEYLHCDLLLYTIATVLNSALTVSDIDENSKSEYNSAIINWLEQTSNSPVEKAITNIQSYLYKLIEINPFNYSENYYMRLRNHGTW